MDWDNDGKNDLLSGDTEGNVWLFLNLGTKSEPELAEGSRIEADGKAIAGENRKYKQVNGKYELDKVVPASHKLADIYSKIHMADWNDDGLKDLLIGHNDRIVMYKNIGTKSAPRFEAPKEIEGGFPSRPSPYVVDWDGDGKRDLLVGSERAEVCFYRNTGTNAKPHLVKENNLELKGLGSIAGYRWRIDVTDWNNDGKKDILIGNFYSTKNRGKNGGNVWLFLGK